MPKPERPSFIEPSYRRTTRSKYIDGVQFHTYHIGIMAYVMISEDGQIKVWKNENSREGRLPWHFAAVIGHGGIKNDSGNPKQFRTEDAACRAAVQIWRDGR